MTSVTSDFDDTIVPAPRPHVPFVELGEDLEATTITWRRPVTAPVELVEPPIPPGPPAVTTAPIPVVGIGDELPAAEPLAAEPPAAEPPAAPAPSADEPPAADEVADDQTVATPPALVDPSAPGIPSPPADLPAALADNVWLAPVPEKPRPFRLRLDDGTLVPLDQPVYLGRKPSVPRIHPGGIPLLVTLDSPQREVSATHLVLSTVGGAIVARDLRSSNGSIVRVPGSVAHTLLGGESAVVTPGTVIELGDGNSIELLAPDPRQEDERGD